MDDDSPVLAGESVDTLDEIRAILSAAKDKIGDKDALIERLFLAPMVGGKEEEALLARLSAIRGWASVVKRAQAMYAARATPVSLTTSIDLIRESDPSGLSEDAHGILHVRCGLDGAETLHCAWQVMRAGKDEGPPIYRQPGRLVRVIDGIPVEVGSDALRGLLAQRALWYKWKADKDEWKQIPLPPSEYPAIMASGAMAAASEVPVLEAILQVPYVDASGGRVVDPGYNSADKTLLLPHDLSIQMMRMGEAREFLIDWIADFPFATDSGKAHAIGLALTPLVRRMIKGPVPPVLIEAPKPRTGKTLLAQALAAPSSGWVAVRPFPDRPEEQEKSIFAALLKGKPVIVLDNLKGRIDSPTLEMALTAYPTVSGRILGASEEVEVAARSQWILTSNNGEFSEDMIGRLVVIRLDRRTERPDLLDVSKLRHPDIKGWMEANKSKLLSALLTLVSGWVQAGKQGPADGTPGKGSFEAWRDVVGGILNHAGINGFLQVASANRIEADEWRGFVTLWAKKFGEGKARLKELYQLCQTFEVLQEVLGSGNEQAQLIRLGRAIQGRRDQIFDVNRTAILAALKADDEDEDTALERCRLCEDNGLLEGGWKVGGLVRIQGSAFYKLVRL
jgi:hypothetical protein